MNSRTIVAVCLMLLLGSFSWYVSAMHRISVDAETRQADLQRAIAEHRVALATMVIQRQQDLDRMELQMAMVECNGYEGGYSSIERQPCRLICASPIDDRTQYTQALSEGVCEALK